MKKIVTSVFVVLSALTACTVQNQGQSYDEVYYSPNDKAAIVQSGSPAVRKSTKEVVVKTDSSNVVGSYIGNNPSNPQGYKSMKDSGAYVTDNNFNYDNYYDYSYASRIRRFGYSPFNDYYNDFYTNRYWYDYNPGYFGSSIYSNWGLGMGMSYYMDPFSMSWGMYSPFNNFYDPFSPYEYYSPFGYNSFGMGYNMGYYNGLYGLGYGGYGNGIYSYSPGYANTLDKNSAVYYGPKRDLSSSNGPIPSERTAFSQRYNALTGGGGGATSVSSPANGREVMNNGTSGAAISNGVTKVANANTATSGASQRETVTGNRNLFGSSSTGQQAVVNGRDQLNRNNINRYISDQQVKKPDSRSVQQQQGGYFKDKAIAPSNSGNVRYTKPQQVANPQQYYNPSNARPRSSNEYTSPGYRNPAAYNSAPQRSLSDPQRYAPPRVYQSPSGTVNSGREAGNYNSYRQTESAPAQQYNAPARSSYTAPSQTYSAPAQTYSAPTQTYSAPSGGNARESGSGSSSSGGSVSSPRR